VSIVYNLNQYVIYDYDSFIADIGGYLGLLLGHSAFSVYVYLAGWRKKKIGCRKRNSRPNKPVNGMKKKKGKSVATRQVLT
jgi:hypothetical protein